MRYFWLLDQYAQKNFNFKLHPGLENLGDYPSKKHTGTIHQHVRPYYLHMDNSPMLLPRAAKPSTQRGCAKILGDTYAMRVPLPSIQSRVQASHPAAAAMYLHAPRHSVRARVSVYASSQRERTLTAATT